MEVVVPDLGDFSDVEVIEVLVEVGDTVEAEDPLIVLETDKATMEVPSSDAGKITAIKVKAGDRVSGGDAIVTLEPSGAAADAGREQDAEPQKQPEPDKDARPDEGAEPAAGDAPEDAAAAAADRESGGEGVSPPAPTSQSIAVPDLGDFSDVEVIEVLVSEGDTVEVEDPLIVLETDKATMEVPSTHAGTVTAVKVKAGDRVSAGDAIVDLESTGAGSEPPASTGEAPPKPAEPEPRSAESAGAAEPRRPAGAEKAPPAARSTAVDERRFSKAHASPSVRKLARELGVDLGEVDGSGRKGRVTADDLKAHVKRIMQGGAVAGRGLPDVPEVDFASFGPVETRPLSRIQKLSGPRLHASWVNVPHVTQHDEADITELEEARRELKAEAEEHGVHLTPLAFIMRAAIVALGEFPTFRSSLDADGESLVIKKYFHIGFAVDTPNGLVVPVVRDADRLNLLGLAGALGELSEKARAGKLGSSEIQGGVFTISSLGGIGGRYFTPIINAPEVAILGVSRSRLQPVYEDGALVPRMMLPLSLSYDHRVIDGATAARFTTRLAELLGQGRKLLELMP